MNFLKSKCLADSRRLNTERTVSTGTTYALESKQNLRI
jgi:hypothetical protein